MGLEDAFRSMPLSKLWFDKATIYGVIPGVDADGFTNGKDTVIIENEPCKVVLKGLKASEQSFFGTDNYDAKLLIRVGIDIPAAQKLRSETPMGVPQTTSAPARDIRAISVTKRWLWSGMKRRRR